MKFVGDFKAFLHRLTEPSPIPEQKAVNPAPSIASAKPSGAMIYAVTKGANALPFLSSDLPEAAVLLNLSNQPRRSPMSIESTAFATFEPLIASALKAAASQYFSSKFGPAVAADASKLIDDGLALAAAPSLTMAVSKLPDFFQTIEDVLANKYTAPGPATPAQVLQPTA